MSHQSRAPLSMGYHAAAIRAEPPRRSLCRCALATDLTTEAATEATARLLPLVGATDAASFLLTGGLAVQRRAPLPRHKRTGAMDAGSGAETGHAPVTLTVPG